MNDLSYLLMKQTSVEYRAMLIDLEKIGHVIFHSGSDKNSDNDNHRRNII